MCKTLSNWCKLVKWCFQMHQHNIKILKEKGKIRRFFDFDFFSNTQNWPTLWFYFLKKVPRTGSSFKKSKNRPTVEIMVHLLCVCCWVLVPCGSLSAGYLFLVKFRHFSRKKFGNSCFASGNLSNFSIFGWNFAKILIPKKWKKKYWWTWKVLSPTRALPRIEICFVFCPFLLSIPIPDHRQIRKKIEEFKK